MKTFDHIINWKLKKGSHDFPGPDGGTCINEAAIIAAGFQYKKVNSASDCPPCFSRPIAAYAIRLNDSMPDKIRNELLMPFVTRLSGTSDTKDVETARVKYMAIETVKRILPLVCEHRLKRADLADKCRAVTTLKQSTDVSKEVKDAAYAAAYDAADAADAAYAAAYAINAAAYAVNAADAASKRDSDRHFPAKFILTSKPPKQA